ncbi:hypothetical protein AHAS_Ahas19G0099100 [Arachis hypogaea]
MRVMVPDDLSLHLLVCSTKSLLLSFECIEWHPTDRVRRQFGLVQLPSEEAFWIEHPYFLRTEIIPPK